MSAFDPYTQNITLLMADGVTPLVFSVADVDAFNFYNTAACINFGTQCGASIIMFLIVLVFVKEANKWKVLHIINLLSLLLSFLRSFLYAIYFVSPWDELYVAFSMDASALPRSAYATSIAGTVMPLLLTASVNTSLLLQAHSVCQTMRDAHRYAIICMSMTVVGLAVGFRFAETVVFSIKIMDSENAYNDEWITVGTLATETISIWFFSLVFVGKLVAALYVRKRHGWKQYSAMQVLAIGGCCTMIIPSIFAILEYVQTNAFPEAGSIALTTVALLLPLSAIWAGMLTNSTLPSINIHSDAPSSHGSVFPAQRKMFGSASSAPSSGIEFQHDDFRRGSGTAWHPMTPCTIDSRIENAQPRARDSTEIDLESMGVRVDRSYSVHSG
ncbi:hypothetical protein BP5796_11107 [Coleophoma crateriformis]|uniref:Pheromone alpha factor receptor n=1 Tax=Coleophoma crateriformis TaxID=565419 RepID=A0A3D8QLY3_9HELO|nr:hypothetical protein BP5796_11107 [Coleophoma crateriformis]